MKELKMCYSVVDNLGDLINPYIVKEVFGYDAVYAKQYDCTISGIGSGLRRYFVPKNDVNKSFKSKLKFNLKKLLKGKELIIWSAGFLTTPEDELVPIKKNIKIASVRGELSKKKLEEIYGSLPDTTTGDGGLLVSELIKEPWNKKYKLGIIPHIREKDEKIWKEIADKIGNTIIIDVTGDAMENLKLISECECIISSSLHGLILADSFNIPNIRVVLTEKILGDGFKYKDYYSIYGIDPEPYNLAENSNIDIDEIIKNYPVKKEEVDRKKEEIKKAFTKYLVK